MNNRRQDARIYKASYILQSKVGSGPLDETIVRQCQEVINTNTFDFVPLASKYLEEFRALIDAGRKARAGDELEDIRRDMTQVVMQIKANAGTFHYPLVSRLAEIMLFFLENVQTIDDDVLDIAQAHYRTLGLILERRLKESDEKLGRDFERELKSACGRYFAKTKIEPQDAFFVEF